MAQESLKVKENVSVNAANAASVEPANVNGMKQETMSENVTYFTSDELGRLGKDLGIKPTAVKARVDGEEVRIVVAHTEYGMRHDRRWIKCWKRQARRNSLPQDTTSINRICFGKRDITSLTTTGN